MNCLNTEKLVLDDFFRFIFFYRFYKFFQYNTVLWRIPFFKKFSLKYNIDIYNKRKNLQIYKFKIDRKNFSNLREKINGNSLIKIFQKKIKFNFLSPLSPSVNYDRFPYLIFVNNFKNFKEIIVSFSPKAKKNWNYLKLNYFPKWVKFSLGPYLKLNNFQAKIFPFIFGTDCNLLIGAPTGIGKTVLIILSILRLIVNSIKLNLKKGKLDQKFIKVLYIAPLKALVKEIVITLKNCFNHIGFIICEITGDSLIDLTRLNLGNIMIGTPDKIESILQKSDKIKVFRDINLLIIDEIHFLKEERGAILENLLVYFKKNSRDKKGYLRIISLSATIPNFYDLAKFLNVSIIDGVFYFGPFIRENPLNQVVLSVNSGNYNLNDLKLLNKILIQKTINIIDSSKNPKILIFVQSRKDTYRTGFSIIEEINKKNSNNIDTFKGFGKIFPKNTFPSLKNLLKMGIGIHHSGLSKIGKNFMENKFKSGSLKVLITTNTLAWGVNLNPKNVIIKGTRIYSPKKASWIEISGTNIVQMLGRTGRFNSDKNCSSFLLTISKNTERFLKIIKNQTPVESTILNRLPDYLNIEITFKRVQSFLNALDWFSQTFFWIRIKRLLTRKFTQKEKFFNKKLTSVTKSFFISQSLNELSSSGLIYIKIKENLISTTIYGKISGFYQMNYQTFVEIISKFSPNQNLCQLLELVSISNEFNSFLPRKNENCELNRLAKIVPIPIKFSKRTKDYKINVLVQSYIENIIVKNDSLVIDSSYICKKALKLSRIMFEISLIKKWAKITQLCIDLYLAIKNRGWYNQKDIWRSLKGRIKKKYSEHLKKKNLTIFGIQNLKKKEIEYIINSKKRSVDVLESTSFLPIFDFEISVKPVTRFTLKIYVNLILLLPKLNYSSERFLGVWIFIEDKICDTLIYVKYLGLINANLKKNYKIFFLIPILENPFSPYYSIKLKFEHNPILNTEYKIDLTEILYPLNFSFETLLSNFCKTPMSRLLIGFKTGNSLREYFSSHLKNLSGCLSNHIHINLKGGQNKIVGLFRKKSKNFFQEFSIIINLLMRKKCELFFSKNSTESIFTKTIDFKKGSMGVIGIPVKNFFSNYFISKRFFDQKKGVCFLKKVEILSILKNFKLLKDNHLIVILDLVLNSFNLELEPSLELILETLQFEEKEKENLSIIISTSRILNMIDLLKIVKFKNTLICYPIEVNNHIKFKKIDPSLELNKNYNKKKKNSKRLNCSDPLNFKKGFWRKKMVYFSFNIKDSLKKIIKSILSLNIFFKSDSDYVLKKNYIQFYISRTGFFTKSQKFFSCFGYGIHDFELKSPKRKFLEEINLAGFFRTYWISIPSLIKIPIEKIYFSIGVMENLILNEYPFCVSSLIFYILSERCDKITINSKEYVSSKILRGSFDFSLESSWKKYLLEKFYAFYNSKKLRISRENLFYNKINFFITRIQRNPGFYFVYNKNFKEFSVYKFLVSLFIKFRKNKIFFLKTRNYIKKTLKGIIMNKYFCLEFTSRFLIREFFLKRNQFKSNDLLKIEYLLL